MQQGFESFERQHKIPNRGFGSGYYDRLRSPSSASPESQQSLYPSIDLEPSPDHSAYSSINKSAGQKSMTAPHVESPKRQDGDLQVERTQSVRSGRQLKKSEGFEVASGGTLSSRTTSGGKEGGRRNLKRCHSSPCVQNSHR
jgi:hypothetical protein